MDVITSVLSADGTKKGIFVEVNEVFTGLNDSRFCSNRYSSRSYGEKILKTSETWSNKKLNNDIV